MIRRLFDVLVASAALVLMAPLLAVLAIAVKLDSPGGAFYGGRRVGKGGRRFRLWKLRTMVVDADRTGPGVAAKHDPRITRVGRFLRRTRLDELPQFWNLLRGDLTLIGPRAEDPDIVKRYTEEQRWVLSVKPGLTGPGTIHYALSQEDTFPSGESSEEYYLEHLLDRKLEVDLQYLRNRTFLKDLRLLLSTGWFVVRAMVTSAGRAGPGKNPPRDDPDGRI